MDHRMVLSKGHVRWVKVAGSPRSSCSPVNRRHGASGGWASGTMGKWDLRWPEEAGSLAGWEARRERACAN